MKNMSKKQKMLLTIFSIIILIGIIVICVSGFNFDLKYKESKRIELHLQKSFEQNDIKQIINEVIPEEKVLVQKIEVYEESANIILSDITEEQKEQIIAKVNEKYETSIENDSVKITSIPNMRFKDIVKPYIKALAIVTIIVLIYLAIRYHKLNSLNIVIKTIAIILYVQAAIFSIIAIARIPVGITTPSVIILGYIITILCIANCLEKKLQSKIEFENKK